MRVLLIHPEDSPWNGPWARQRWDLVIDLGKSSQISEQAWAEHYQCRVLRAESFRQGIADVRRVKEIFSAGRGRLVDEEGIDWWDLTSLLVASEVLSLLALERLVPEIDSSAELWSTRRGWLSNMIGALTGRPVRSFVEGQIARVVARAGHYVGMARHFSAAKIKEIFLDKYDAGYRWRSRFASQPKSCSIPVVLVPSAYGNVSRTAAGYAQLLPRQSFLMVATRQSAKRFTSPSNFQIRDLGDYAKASPPGEAESLLQRWFALQSDLSTCRELQVLIQTGILNQIPGWIRDGLCARDAWRQVLEGEPVCGVLCGDDSNLYTRLPVLLAARRKIPTVDFHHGGFDGRYLLKDLPCDVYLAKNEMERDYLLRVCGLPPEKIVIGAPPVVHSGKAEHTKATSAIFFSEPYEIVGMRTEEVYREVLPPLCRLAREMGLNVIIKLHPFENYSQRRRMVENVLQSEDREMVTLREGPLTGELLSEARFGITVESTTVMDCWQNGVCCFVCEWLALLPYGYMQQYARFGVGELLENAERMCEIPQRLEKFHQRPENVRNSWETISPALLERLLTQRCELSTARPVA